MLIKEEWAKKDKNAITAHDIFQKYYPAVFRKYRKKLPAMMDFSKEIRVLELEEVMKQRRHESRLVKTNASFSWGLVDGVSFWRKSQVSGEFNHFVAFRNKRPSVDTLMHEIGHCYFEAGHSGWHRGLGDLERIVELVAKGYIKIDMGKKDEPKFLTPEGCLYRYLCVIERLYLYLTPLDWEFLRYREYFAKVFGEDFGEPKQEILSSLEKYITSIKDLLFEKKMSKKWERKFENKDELKDKLKKLEEFINNTEQLLYIKKYEEEFL